MLGSVVNEGQATSSSERNGSPAVESARSRRPAVAVGVAVLAVSVGVLSAVPASAAPSDLQPNDAAVAGFDLQLPLPVDGAVAAAAPAAEPVNLTRAFTTAGALYATAATISRPAAKPALSSRARAQVAAARKPVASRSAKRAPAASPRAIGRALVAKKGWSAREFQCLDRLWTKESNWTVTADNPTSSAYGIPQALPGHRMSSHGAKWRTDAATQIRWGLDYIDDRYGKPCSAWAHSRAKNWY